MILQLLTLLGALALFVFGLEMLSTGIQKSCGDRLRRFEKWMTSGTPFKQILSGAGITAVVQCHDNIGGQPCERRYPIA